MEVGASRLFLSVEMFIHRRYNRRREILLMFVKQIFEDFENLENKKRVTLIRPAVAGRQLTAIMKADGFTCTTPLHERSRSAETY